MTSAWRGVVDVIGVRAPARGVRPRFLRLANTAAATRTLLAVALGVATGCEREQRSSSSGAPEAGPVHSTVAGAVEAPPPLPHATDFLTAGCSTLVYAGLDAARRAQCRAAIASRNYTHFYLYAYNELDFGGPAIDAYAAPAQFREHLIELKSAGLEPVVWLAPDDAPEFAAKPAVTVHEMFERLVPAIDDVVSSYVLGLELDEYWPAPIVDSLGSRLSRLTARPIAVHQTPGRWDYCKFAWCDYMVLQYGFDVNTGDIQRMTRSALGELRKPIVAGEYELDSEANAVMRGNHGVAAGAAGFGNGGTPSASNRNGAAPGPAGQD